jgi:predicted small secreted protein
MRFALPLFALSLISLSGCATMNGLTSDVSTGWDKMANWVSPHQAAKEEKKKLPVYDGTCPNVTVRPDLKHLVEFSDPAKPSDDTKISDVTIQNVENVCRIENSGLIMQLDISLYGQTGPKGRMKPGDKPSFAYPYFVAVTDEQGNVVSKEIFAASLAYGKEQKDINQTETVFQAMPFPDTGAGKMYNVIVGLQLTPEQLAYNQRFAGVASPVPASTQN